MHFDILSNDFYPHTTAAQTCKEDSDKIGHMTKIWNDRHSLKQLG